MSSEDNESKKAFYKALAKMQGELEHAKKDSTNPHFKSKYADLYHLDAARKPMSENGFSISHGFYSDNGNDFVTCSLFHADGYSISSTLPILAAKRDMQGIGSAITYARRYTLAAIIGLGQDDDDANTASQATPQRQGNVPQPQIKVTPSVFSAPVQNKATPSVVTAPTQTKVTINVTNPEHRSLIGKALKETGLDVWVTEGNNKNLITAHLAGEKPMADLQSIIDSITRYAVTATSREVISDVQL